MILMKTGMIEFHPEDQRPRIDCPKCQLKGIENPTNLYWIRGFKEGEYDDGILAEFFSLPTSNAGGDMETLTRALHLQRESAIRRALKTEQDYQQLQNQQTDLFLLLKRHTAKPQRNSNSTNASSDRDPDLPPLPPLSQHASAQRPRMRPAPPPTPPRTDRIVRHEVAGHVEPHPSTMTYAARSSTARQAPPQETYHDRDPRPRKRQRPAGEFVISLLEDEPVAPAPAPNSYPRAVPSPPRRSPPHERLTSYSQQYPGPAFLGSVRPASWTPVRASTATGARSRHFHASPAFSTPASPHLVRYSRTAQLKEAAPGFQFRSPPPPLRFRPREPEHPTILRYEGPEPASSPTSYPRLLVREDALRQWSEKDGGGWQAPTSRERMPPPPVPEWRGRGGDAVAFSQPRVRSRIGAREMGMEMPMGGGWVGREGHGVMGRG